MYFHNFTIQKYKGITQINIVFLNKGNKKLEEIKIRKRTLLYKNYKKISH